MKTHLIFQLTVGEWVIAGLTRSSWWLEQISEARILPWQGFRPVHLQSTVPTIGSRTFPNFSTTYM